MFINNQYLIKNKRGFFQTIYSLLLISVFITVEFFFCPDSSSAQQSQTSTEQIQTSTEKKELTDKSGAATEKQDASPEYRGVYNVRKHDTLWDISGKALKSPEKWPALWGNNPHIRNPHWIYPGETIYLDQQKKLPPANQPASLPPVEPLQRVEVNPPYYYFYPLMESVGYIKEKAVDPVGKIISCMPKHQKEIEQGNGVYLAMDDESDLMVGDQFQILRTFYIRDRNSASFPLVHHYITGVVRVTKLKAEPCKCHEQISQVEGEIITAYRTISPDDILVPYNSSDSKILVRQSKDQINARILFSEDHTDKIAENAVVFIDKGRDDGLQTGQFYNIFNQPRGELIDSDQFVEKTEQIGSLVVLRMEDKTSAALITYAYKDISPGDIMVSPDSDDAFSNITMMGHYR